jgi:hypothetical protein
MRNPRVRLHDPKAPRLEKDLSNRTTELGAEGGLMIQHAWRKLLIVEIAMGALCGFANWPRTVGLSAADIKEAGFPVVFLLTLGERVDYLSVFAALIDAVVWLGLMAIVAAIIVRRCAGSRAESWKAES